jgi:hypothetical protein
MAISPKKKRVNTKLLFRKMTITRREKHILIILVILLPILAFIPQTTVKEYEVFFHAFITFPLGLYIATDPERILRSRKKQ